MSSPEPRSDRASGGGMSRRAMMSAAAWSAPVVALAVAAPAAAASGENPTFIPIDAFGDDTTQMFGIQMLDLPALPASAEGDYAGLIVDFCLPEGFQITSVHTAGWSFVNFGDGFEGGDAFVFNTTAIAAGTDRLVEVAISKDPDLGPLSGTMDADVVIGSTGFPVVPLMWSFQYGDGGSSISCGAARRG